MSRGRPIEPPTAADDAPVAATFPPAVYQELRKLAAQKLANEKAGHTLQPTALVHEVYLRLRSGSAAGQADGPRWNSDGHFYAAAAEAMRRILVEAARRKSRVKHGGGRRRVELNDRDVTTQPPPEDIVALDDALGRLAEEDPEAARVVELHFFAGLSIEQAAEALGLSRATVYRQWAYARAWLRCAVEGEQA